MMRALCVTVLLATMFSAVAKEDGNKESEVERLRKDNAQLTKLVNALNHKINLSKDEQGEFMLEQQQFRAAHERRVFWWQLIISYTMFAAVLVLILGGFWMSWLQFRHAIAIRPDDTSSLKSDLEISAEKIRLNTTLVGLLILAIALGFSALLLWIVYPIKAL